MAAKPVLAALRRQIARIEGVLAEPLADLLAPAQDAGGSAGAPPHGGIILRRRLQGRLPSGAAAFDAALGGGLPLAALTEITGAAFSAAGPAFALGLCLRLLSPERPLLWLLTREAAGEAGRPYLPGMTQAFGLAPQALLYAEAARLADLLWIAEEAAAAPGFGAVIVEVGAGRLDLTATRRLHGRARTAGHPVFLVRHGGGPSAAPVRLAIASAAAAPRQTLAGAWPQGIGNPVFTVAIAKAPAAPEAEFHLEWTLHDRHFHDRPPLSVPVVSPPVPGPDPAPAPWPLLAQRRSA